MQKELNIKIEFKDEGNFILLKEEIGNFVSIIGGYDFSFNEEEKSFKFVDMITGNDYSSIKGKLDELSKRDNFKYFNKK